MSQDKFGGFSIKPMMGAAMSPEEVSVRDAIRAGIPPQFAKEMAAHMDRDMLAAISNGPWVNGTAAERIPLSPFEKNKYPQKRFDMLMSRPGTFTISRIVIEREPLQVMRFMANIIVLRAEQQWPDDLIRYHAVSPMFDEVEKGAVAPEYVVEFTDIGGMKVTRAEVKAVKDRMLLGKGGPSGESE